MDIISPKICLKHNIEARFMCTRVSCFNQENILVCPECSSQHQNHQNELIETNQLNQKVHQLMKKRMDFQQNYQIACEMLIQQLKKFKLFKIQLMNLLNFKERTLNQLCKKIKRNIPYQKDKNLFKKSLNHVYLAMRGINPNYDLYRKFQQTVKQTLAECRKSLCKLQINLSPIPLFQKKDQQLAALVKKITQQPIEQLKFQEPSFKQFKKQTLKFSKQQQQIQSDSKLFRLSNQQFLAYNQKCHYLKWYNTDCFLLPRSVYVGHGIENLTVLGKNVFLTEKGGRMSIYDLINQKIIKEYASTNHKNAQICNVLSLDSQTLLNFVTSPNQIVTLKFLQQTQQLKMIKGIQTNSRCMSSLLMDQNFIASFDDRTIGVYRSQLLKAEHYINLSGITKRLTAIDNNTFVAGTDQSKMYLIDKRMSVVSLSIPTIQQILDVKKIYPSSILCSHGKSLKIYDLKVQKQLFINKVDEATTNLEILNSESFVASGKNLHLWKGVS